MCEQDCNECRVSACCTQFTQFFLSFLVLIIRTMGTINRERRGWHTYIIFTKEEEDEALNV